MTDALEEMARLIEQSSLGTTGAKSLRRRTSPDAARAAVRAAHPDVPRAEALGVRKPAGRIFISYRRADTSDVAGRLADQLKARFGAENVFMDVNSIEPGQDFAAAIKEAVSSCRVLVALIGRCWADAIDEQGRRRLDDPDDFVAREITTALQRGIRVIPVLVDGATPPWHDDLPVTLEPLARHQSIWLEHVSLGVGVDRLMAEVERTLHATETYPCSNST